jgi:hypothetical protein
MAKVLSLKLDIEKLNFSEEDKKQTSQSIISKVVENVILSYAQTQRGFDEKERRQYYKIADALELAVKDNAEMVSLEDDQAGFLKKCFRESRLLPNNLLRQIEELVNNINDR